MGLLNQHIGTHSSLTLGLLLNSLRKLKMYFIDQIMKYSFNLLHRSNYEIRKFTIILIDTGHSL